MGETVIRELVTRFKGDMGALESAMEMARHKATAAAAGIAESFGPIGIAVGIAAVGIASIGVAAIEAGKEINEAWRTIQVKTGEVGQSLEELKADFAAVFAQVPESAKGVADAIAQIHQRTGETGAALQELATKEIELAHITGAQLGPQIEATTKLFQNWAGQIKNPGDALELLFTISQKTGIGVTKLAEEMNSAGPVMRQLGIGFQQGAAMLAQLDKEGIDSAKVMAGMSISFRKIVKDGEDPIRFFGELIQRMKDAGSAAEANRLAIQFFGKGAATMGEAVRAGRLDVEGLVESLKGSHQSIGQTAADVETVGEAFEKFSHNITLLLAPLGQEMIKAMKDALKSIEDFVSENRVLITEGIGKIIELFRGMGTIIGNVLKSAGDIMRGEWGKSLSDLIDMTDKATGKQQNIFQAYASWLTGTYWPGLARAAKSIFSDLQDIVVGALSGDAGRALGGKDWNRSVKTFTDSFHEMRAAADETGVRLRSFKDTFHEMSAASEKAWVAAGSHAQAGGAAISKAAKGAHASIKEDLGAAFALVQDWLKQTDQAIGLSSEAFKHLPKSVRDSLTVSAQAFHENSLAAEEWGARVVAALQGTGLQVRKVGEHFTIANREIEKSFADLGGKIEEDLTVGSGAMIAFGAAHAEASHKAQEANKQLEDSTRAAHDTLVQSYEDLSKRIPESFNLIIDAILNKSGLLGEELLKVAVKVKGFVADALGVIGTMPGKIGDSLRKTTQTIEQWISFVDRAIKLLQGIFGQAQTGIAGLLSSIGDLFKSHAKQIGDVASMTQDQIQKMAKSASGAGATGAAAAKGLSSVWGKASDELKIGVSAAAGAFASLTTAMAVTSQTGSKTAGVISSLFTSTLAGIQAGMAFGPVGGAIVGGISLLGGIIGAFMGKSPLQKAQEAAALQKAKDDIKKSQEEVLQMVEKTKQSWIETLDKARQLLESIQFYTRVPKVNFQAFFKDVGKLFEQLVPLAQKWKLDASKDIAAAAENLKAGVELVARLPQALDSISKYLGTPDASFAAFFAATDKFFDMLGDWMESIGRKVQRKIGVFGDRVKGGVDLFKPLIDALNAMFTIKELPTEEKFKLLDDAINLIIQHVGDLAQRWDKQLLKEIEFFSTKVLSALEAWIKTIEAIKAMTDIPVVTDTDADRVAGNLRMFLERMISALHDMATDELTRLAAISETILPIAAAIKAWAEAAAAIKGYVAVAAETWDLIQTDFARGLTLIRLMILQAQDYVDDAKKFKDLIDQGSALISEALKTYTESIQAMATALREGLPQGGAPLTTPAAGGLGSFGIQSMSAAGLGGGGGFGGSGGLLQQYYVTVHVEGSLIQQSELGDFLIRALQNEQSRGRSIPMPLAA